MQLEAWLLPLTPPVNTQISGPVWKTTLHHVSNLRYPQSWVMNAHLLLSYYLICRGQYRTKALHLNKHQSTGPWTKTPPNCPKLNHILEVILHLLIQVRWYSSIPFLERLVVSNFDIMFQNIALA